MQCKASDKYGSLIPLLIINAHEIQDAACETQDEMATVVVATNQIDVSLGCADSSEDEPSDPSDDDFDEEDVVKPKPKKPAPSKPAPKPAARPKSARVNFLSCYRCCPFVQPSKAVLGKHRSFEAVAICKLNAADGM